MVEHDPGVGAGTLAEPAVFIGPADGDGAFAIPTIDGVVGGTDDDAELAMTVVGGIDEDDLAAEGADGELRPADHLHGGPALKGEAHGTAGLTLFAGMDEGHVIAIDHDLDKAAVGFGNDDADE